MWDFNKYSSNTAIVYKNKSFSYNFLENFSKEINNNLKKRSLIILISDNSISSYLGYISFLYKRHIQIVLDINTYEVNINKIIKNFQPNYVWCKRELLDKLKLKIIYNFNDYNLYLFNKKDIRVHKDLALLCSTSGTTGNQKFIKQSFYNIKNNTDSILKYQKLKSNDSSITTLPLSYTYGMSCLNTLLKVGAKLIITNNSILQKDFWKVFNNQSITILNGVPFTYAILRKLKFFEKKSKIKIFTQAGGKLSDDMQKLIAKFAFKNKSKFFIMYGQAEATTRISYLPHNLSLKKIGSVGKPIDKGKIILKVNGRVLKTQNIVGNIFYKGPNVCLGYSFSKSDLNKKKEWVNGINTGDLGKFDDEGYLYIVGREKRFAKIYGLSINLEDIENIIIKSFPKLEVASININDKIVIFINKKYYEEKILNLLNKSININKSVFIFKYINIIPKLVNGKKNYTELQNTYFSR